MTRRDALLEGTRILADGRQGGSESPSLDASLLLAAALSIEKERLLASLPEGLDEVEHGRYLSFIESRSKGKPVAYILGHKEFWAHDFLVDERVLIPRPDTELLVEEALRMGDGIVRARSAEGRGPLRCHEACTGSGCVAISLAFERPSWIISASDISAPALEVAALNARSLLPASRSGGEVDLCLADLFELPGRGDYDLLLANPPYVGSAEASLLAASWGEPLLALDGGPDGLAPYHRIASQASRLLAPGGCLLLEADPSQAPRLRALLSEAGFVEVETKPDLAGHPRVSMGRKPWTS
jgi:release factor glutamine methyltransferase